MIIDLKELDENLKHFSLIEAVDNDDCLDVKLKLNYGLDYQATSSIAYFRDRWFYGLPYKNKAVRYSFSIPFLFNNGNNRITTIPNTVNEIVRSNSHYSIMLLNYLIKQAEIMPIKKVHNSLINMGYKMDYSNFTLNLNKHKTWLNEQAVIEYEQLEEDAYFVMKDNGYIESTFEKTGEFDFIQTLGREYCGEIVNAVNNEVDLISLFNSNLLFANQDKDCIQPARLMIPVIISVLSNISSVVQSKVATSSLELLEKLDATFITNKKEIQWCNVENIKKFIQRFNVDTNTNHINKEYDDVEDKFNTILRELDLRSKKLQKTDENRRILVIDGTKVDVKNSARNNKKETDYDEGAPDNQTWFGYNVLVVSHLLQSSLVPLYFTVDGMGRHDASLYKKTVDTSGIFNNNDLILVDRGFIDFDLMYELKTTKHIDTLTPGKKNLLCVKEILAQVRTLQESDYKLIGNQLTKLYDTKVVTSNKKELNLKVLVIMSNKEGKFVNESGVELSKDSELSMVVDDKKYIVFLYTGDDLTDEQILNKYKKRWSIEVGFQDMIGNMTLKRIRAWKLYSIEFHLATVILAKAIVELYKNTEQGVELIGTTVRTLAEGINNQPNLIGKSKTMIVKDKKYKLYFLSLFVRTMESMNREANDKALLKMEKYEIEE